MKIVTFERRKGSQRAGLIVNHTRVLDIGRAYSKLQAGSGSPEDTSAIIDTLRGLSASVLELLHASDDTLAHCFELEKAAQSGSLEDCIFPIGDTPLIAPIPNPPLVLHFDAHEGHAKAVHRLMGADRLPDAWYRYPVYHYGNPNSMLGPGAPVAFPDGEKEMDWEFELACVLGEDVRDASLEEAEEAILGYTVVNDWTCRGHQRDLIKSGLGYAKAKAFATSIGPHILTKEEVPTPYQLKMVAKVNGKQVCEANSGDTRFSFAEMISYASEGTTLPAGTLILSGACNGGSGLEAGAYLKPGDEVVLDIDGVGTLKSKVYDRPTPRIFRPRMDMPD